MSEVFEVGLVQKDKLKDIMREILMLEKERETIKEDLVRRKEEMCRFFPKNLVGKAIKVFLNKGLTGEQVLDYQTVSDILGIPFACDFYQPNENNNMKSEEKKEMFEVMKAYENLITERNEVSCEIRDVYCQAKNIGVSVPLLKKAIDFCLHPDKLEIYQESVPLLDTYIDISAEVN